MDCENQLMGIILLFNDGRIFLLRSKFHKWISDNRSGCDNQMIAGDYGPHLSNFYLE